jgi:hypothetical protein
MAATELHRLSAFSYTADLVVRKADDFPAAHPGVRRSNTPSVLQMALPQVCYPLPELGA